MYICDFFLIRVLNEIVFYSALKSFNIRMMNDSNMQHQTDSDSDEQTVQYLRESYSQIGLCSNVNQSSCLDSAFEFNFILPRIFLPTCQEELSVKASTFIGTAHFLAPFVLRFLFNRSTVENFRKTRFSLH